MEQILGYETYLVQGTYRLKVMVLDSVTSKVSVCFFDDVSIVSRKEELYVELSNKIGCQVSDFCGGIGE